MTNLYSAVNLLKAATCRYPAQGWPLHGSSTVVNLLNNSSVYTNHYNNILQVVFPDLSCQWFIPKRDDFHVISPQKQRLSTTVILSHLGWSGMS